MRALLQRVSQAAVRVDGEIVGQCGPGLLILICAMQGDTEAQADQLAAKIAKLRIFTDEAGKMNRSIADIAGSALVVSQFTLAADTSRGNRPGFSYAAPPAEGKRVQDQYKDWVANDELMALGKEDVIYMHPLPADRDIEVTSSVLDGRHSVVFDEAENRLHAQKAVMALTMS